MVAFATATVGASGALAASASTFAALEHESLNRIATPASKTADVGKTSFRIGKITAGHSGSRSRVSPLKSPATCTLAQFAAPWILSAPRLPEVRRRYRAERRPRRGNRHITGHRAEYATLEYQPAHRNLPNACMRVKR